MKCPKCSLENPPTAMWCDCGYNFETKSMNQKIKSNEGEASPESLVVSNEIKIASTLSWVWGIFNFVGFLIFAPGLVHGGFVFPILILIFSVVFCNLGFGIRKLRRNVTWRSLLAIPANIIFLFYFRFPIWPISLVIGVIVALIIIKNWKSFAR
jgi:hypothetical protein